LNLSFLFFSRNYSSHNQEKPLKVSLGCGRFVNKRAIFCYVCILRVLVDFVKVN